MNNHLKAKIAMLVSVALVATILGVTILMPAGIRALFQDTGTIGDTVGGIAGPILNFAGMFVVYLSLREQLKANQLQMEALRHEQTKTEHEKLLLITERAIDATSREMEVRKALLKTTVDFIRGFDSKLAQEAQKQIGTYDIGQLDSRAKQEIYDQSKEILLFELENHEFELSNLAGLLAVFHSTISRPDFPSEYFSYCIDLFNQKCVQLLDFKISGRLRAKELKAKDIANTNYIMWAIADLRISRNRFYRETVLKVRREDHQIWRI